MSKTRILLLIAAFLTVTIGSFIYYVATWDNREAKAQAPAFILAQKLPPEAPIFSTGAVS